MASDWRFLISRIPAVANRKIGVEACFATGSGRGGGGEWGRLKISMAVFFELGGKIWQVFSSGCVA